MNDRRIPLDQGGKNSLSPQETESRIKRLTSLAVDLFKRGSYEPAFDSLMKAYLLDPSSQHVVDCEKSLLPAIEMMRRRGPSRFAEMTGSSENVQLATFLVQQIDSVLRDTQIRSGLTAGGKRFSATDSVRKLQAERISALKQKHEQTKKEHEQQIWRRASSPPKIENTNNSAAPASKTLASESSKAPEGILGKSRPGKFFT